MSKSLVSELYAGKGGNGKAAISFWKIYKIDL